MIQCLLLAASVSFAGPVELPRVPSVEVPALPAAQPSLTASPAAEAPAPSAEGQLRAALPAEGAPPEPERLDYLYSGGAAAPEAAAVEAEPAGTPMTAVRADLSVLMGYLEGGRGAGGLARRLEEVRANGGIPRAVRTGWLSWETRVEPLDPFVTGQLASLSAAVAHIRRSPGSMGVDLALNDLFYSVHVLAQRAASSAAFAEDLRWLYGTFGLAR